MFKRLLTISWLLPCFLGLILLSSKGLFLVTLSFCIAIAAWEWTKLLPHCTHRYRVFYIMVHWLLVGILVFLIPLFWLKVILGLVVGIWALSIPMVLFYPSTAHWLTSSTIVMLGMILLPTAFASFFILAFELRSTHVMLWLCLLIWLMDSCAYLFGRAFGHHKLLPAVSPGKTWAGFWGAILASLMTICLMYVSGFSTDFLQQQIVSGNFLLFFFSATFFVILGDLFISMLKRSAGLKDIGTLFPGHGGLLDRIDSMLPVLPLATVYFLS